MKTLGMIGGTSWQSTQLYYRLLNEAVAQRLGGLHSAKLLLASVDFAEVAAWQHAGEFARLEAYLVDLAVRLAGAGADGLVLCANTMHRYVPAIMARVPTLHIVHIAETTARAITTRGMTRVALLGTKATMSEMFYRDILTVHGIAALVPTPTEQDEVHRIIFEELCRGNINETSRQTYQAIIAQLQQAGAQGAILGCTEIPLLIRPSDVDLPIFDTTAIHATAAVDWMLE